jgi:uncharacterized protein (DUF2147 family)
MKFHLTPLAFLLVLLFSQNVIGQSPDAIKGEWYSGDKEAKIEIFEEGNKYHGKIVWLNEPTENGKPKVDKNNPEITKQNRPIEGLRLLRNFEYDNGKWNEGTIYDPQSGKTYSCTIKMKNENTLEVRGYVGISLIGRTDVWTRAN